jgi:hypothetical protein
LIDVTLRGEFHDSCIDPASNGEASYTDPNGAIDAAVKAKLDNYQHDYSERNFLFLPAVMTTSGRISGDFLCLLYILAHRQAANFFTHMGIPDPSSKVYKHTHSNAGARIFITTALPSSHRARLRPDHLHEDRHHPTQTPSQKTNSPRSRPPLLSPPSTRTPPLLATSD